MSTDDRLSYLRDAFISDAARLFDYHMKWVDSPIERLLLAQMLVDGWEQSFIGRSWSEGFEDCKQAGLGSHPRFLRNTECIATCAIQARGIGPYVIDFAFVNPWGDRPLLIAVELDGHDFHEKTKEQARKDKKRDRTLAAAGWTTLRFTGSEVYADAKAVLREITKFCDRHIGIEDEE